MTDLITQVPSDFDDDELGQSLAQEVEAAVMINFYWYLREWDAGNDPKCCPKCAGIKYRPQLPSTQWFVKTAPVIVEEGYASCESATAMHTAHKRADGFRNLVGGGPGLVAKAATPKGMQAIVQVKDAYRIQLEPQGPSYWHVVSIDEGERHDATEEMER